MNMNSNHIGLIGSLVSLVSKKNVTCLSFLQSIEIEIVTTQTDTVMGIGTVIVTARAGIWIDMVAGIAMMTEAAETMIEVIIKHH